MKWLLFSLYAAVFFFTGSAKAQSSDASKTYAVIIGISQYEDVSIPQLQFADKDARLFAEYLQSTTGGKVPSNQIRLLLNKQATIAAISNAFDWLRETCKQDDVAYIFFSGHGDVETKTIDSLGYLLAYNTPPNNYRNNAIRIADINSDANTLSILKKSKVILITDACHSGKLAGDAYQGRQLAARQLRLIHDNEVRLASCAPDELSAEGPQWGGGRGVFSYYLINGLEGLADNPKDGKVNLKELEHYLDSCFANDKNLLQQNHKQHPVAKGNPAFSLATVDNKISFALKSPVAKKAPTDLEELKPAALTPVDSLFICLADVPVESIINFEPLIGLLPEAVPENFLKACINNRRALDSLCKNANQQNGSNIQMPSIASLQKILKTATKKNIALLFNTSLSGFIHTKAQKMINAYLKGDANEMNRREYYYTGNERYSDFLSMHKLGIGLLTTDNRLYREMEMQQAYLSGLIARLQINNTANKDSLLKTAFQFQHKALALDEGAAYVHNEIGLLFLYKKQFDSADYHFRFATCMAPTWALPWSNLIVLNLNTGNIKKATEAEKEAKKLQPNNDLLLCNEGVLMESQNNFLAAESFFLKAIEVNDNHFFPFGRLGQIYIECGEYAKADSLLYAAAMRLGILNKMAGFSTLREKINDPGRTGSGHHEQEPMWAGKKIPDAFSLLLQALQLYSAEKFSDAESVLKKAIQLSPAIPLANHYLALALIKQSKWNEAENPLKAAINSFLNRDSLKSTLNHAFEIRFENDSNIFIRDQIIQFRYADMEDYYWLAKMYEKTVQADKAIEVYHSIIKIENDKATRPPVMNDLGGYIYASSPVTGYIKLERLLESMGNYNQAEKELLEQFNFIKGTCNSYSFLNNSDYFINAYSITAGEIFNFYERMQKQFPEQADWYKKAGSFLFERIEPAFKNMQPKRYASFYANLSANPYPWIEKRTSEQTETFILPGTGDTINTVIPAVNPVTKSLEYFKKTLQVWGAAEKPAEVVIDIAELNSWMGNKEEAMKWYAEVLDMQPKNSIARNKYIKYLLFCNELPLVAEELQTLYDQKQATQSQQIQLANYRMLAGQYLQSESILKKYSAEDKSAGAKVMQPFATLYYLSGNYKKALQYATDSLLENKILTEDSEGIKKAKQEKNCCRLYTIARYTAAAGNINKAVEILQRAITGGFKKYKYVLENDKAWDSIIKKNEWKKIIAEASYKFYHGENDYSEDDFFTTIAPYRF